MFSLSAELIESLAKQALPSFQLTSPPSLNLGFGFIFYALTRALRPQNIVVIGSKAGFAPVCFALGLKDNEGYGFESVECYDTHLLSTDEGSLHFVDPSYSLERNDPAHNYGFGMWDDPEKVTKIWDRYGVGSVITHFKTTSAEYLASESRHGRVDLLYVDGDHSYAGIMHDFLEFESLLTPTSIVLAHDVHPEFEWSDGYEVLCDLPSNTYEYVRIPIVPGLAIMRPTGAKLQGSPWDVKYRE